MQNQKGFTLIELVVVIVILGILAATAVPKFVDLRSDAEEAAVKGFAGALGSAMTINYAGCSIKNNVVTAGKCVAVSNCTDGGSLLQAALPAGYSITAAAIAGNGTVVNCTVGNGTQTATFGGIGAGQ